MGFKTIESPITDITGIVDVDVLINGAAFFTEATIRAIIFYDAGNNVVTPVSGAFNIKYWVDLEDENAFRELPFYTTNLAAGGYEFVSNGTVSHLTDPLSGISNIGQPVERIRVNFSGVTGAVKAKVKVLAKKARV
jgi:hypothetical protein